MGESEWQDLNLRPLRPERSALPSWATLRENKEFVYYKFQATEKGLEPLLTESESAVLPITPFRIVPFCVVFCCFLLFPVSNMVIISDSKKKSSVFLKKMKKWKNCNNSARAIRKTAPRAYCGWRHCFTHKWALSAYRCPLAKTCRHVLCFPYTVWLNCYKKLKIKKTVHGKASDAPFFKLVKSDQASCNAVCKRRYFTSGSSREIHRLSEYTVADLHISFVIFSF